MKRGDCGGVCEQFASSPTSKKPETHFALFISLRFSENLRKKADAKREFYAASERISEK